MHVSLFSIQPGHRPAPGHWDSARLTRGIGCQDRDNGIGSDDAVPEDDFPVPERPDFGGVPRCAREKKSGIVGWTNIQQHLFFLSKDMT